MQHGHVQAMNNKHAQQLAQTYCYILGIASNSISLGQYTPLIPYYIPLSTVYYIPLSTVYYIPLSKV